MCFLHTHFVEKPWNNTVPFCASETAWSGTPLNCTSSNVTIKWGVSASHWSLVISRKKTKKNKGMQGPSWFVLSSCSLSLGSVLPSLNSTPPPDDLQEPMTEPLSCKLHKGRHAQTNPTHDTAQLARSGVLIQIQPTFSIHCKRFSWMIWNGIQTSFCNVFLAARARSRVMLVPKTSISILCPGKKHSISIKVNISTMTFCFQSFPNRVWSEAKHSGSTSDLGIRRPLSNTFP